MASASILVAGPLNPPVGPVAPTAKPLAEVEPRIAINAENTPGEADSLFRIVENGSYYLTGNVAGVSGKRGIGIHAFEVSIDLMGLSVHGVPGSLDGIAADISSAAVVIRNGVVYDWYMDGIDLFSDGTVFSCLIEDVASWGNAVGIRAGDDGIDRPVGELRLLIRRHPTSAGSTCPGLDPRQGWPRLRV